MNKLIPSILPFVLLLILALSCSTHDDGAVRESAPVEIPVNQPQDTFTTISESPEKPKTPTNLYYVYENGAIHVGGDGDPIELVNNGNAANPTYSELVEFIKQDATDQNTYRKEFGRLSYVCSDYAEDVHNNAEEAGIKAAWVSIQFEGEDEGHALNAFETTDRGLVYIDCTGGNVGGVEYLGEMLGLSSRSSLSESTSPRSTSWDNIVYVEIGKEYGLIHIDVAHSLSYRFYEEYKQKIPEYERLLNEHNSEVIQYNQEIKEKGLGEGSPEQLRIEAREARLEEKEQILDRLSEEYESLLRDYEDEVAQYNQEIEGKIFYKGSSELAAIEAWEARLEDEKRMLDELSKEFERLRSEYNEEVNQYNQEIKEIGFLEGSPEQVRMKEWKERLKKEELILDKLVEELGEFWSEPLGIVKLVQIHW